MRETNCKMYLFISMTYKNELAFCISYTFDFLSKSRKYCINTFFCTKNTKDF